MRWCEWPLTIVLMKADGKRKGKTASQRPSGRCSLVILSLGTGHIRASSSKYLFFYFPSERPLQLPPCHLKYSCFLLALVSLPPAHSALGLPLKRLIMGFGADQPSIIQMSPCLYY